VTLFGEVLPSIPVIADITSVNRFQTDPKRPATAEASANERQRLISVRFTKGMPGDETKRPDGASRPGIETALSHVGDTSRSPRERVLNRRRS